MLKSLFFQEEQDTEGKLFYLLFIILFSKIYFKVNNFYLTNFTFHVDFVDCGEAKNIDEINKGKIKYIHNIEGNLWVYLSINLAQWATRVSK